MIGAIQGILAGAAVQAKEKRPYKKPVLNKRFVPVDNQVKKPPTTLYVNVEVSRRRLQGSCPSAYGSMIPPKIADGSLSSGRSHPPSAYAVSARYP